MSCRGRIDMYAAMGQATPVRRAGTNSRGMGEGTARDLANPCSYHAGLTGKEDGD